ncbi:Nucleotide-binding alpha-beta plait domain-containing protein [Dioscorea alata]|uniref:Nucleotide-binding alpha-beta plait domain-containing protein n=1 Tax=Dioscorea alata TaxID=55571 RepID=A0ACB7TX26_DIOAL|nr:Nucleotide-binding alpha-beta plait domain-containing protein [Dioscorea alata]
MSSSVHVAEITNLSPNATERHVYKFFSFSDAIEHIEIIRSEEFSSTAYVTFSEPYALETAVLLSGAVIVDQHVFITRRGTANEARKFSNTPQEAVKMAAELKGIISKGYVVTKDMLSKAKEFDDSHKVTATATAKIAELSERIGLTDKINTGIDAVRSVDERLRVSEAAETMINSSYFAAGALLLSDALGMVAKLTADFANHGSKIFPEFQDYEQEVFVNHK